jgi:hypothetical protein
MSGTIYFSRNSIPFGVSWEEWAARWWIWCLNQGEERSPALDGSGSRCQQDQIYPQVWFLAGTFGDKAIRRCQVPSGKALFFPIVNDLISFFEYPMINTETELQNYAMRDLDTTTSLSVTINGLSLGGLMDFRVQTNIFEIKVPFEPDSRNHSYTNAVSDGYWMFLKPLSLGRHRILIRGEKLAYDEVGLNSSMTSKTFTVEVDYFLDVIHDKK